MVCVVVTTLSQIEEYILNSCLKKNLLSDVDKIGYVRAQKIEIQQKILNQINMKKAKTKQKHPSAMAD